LEFAKKCEILQTARKRVSFLFRRLIFSLLTQYECPKCFEQSDSQLKYSKHLQSHFPCATVEERAKIDHIVSSKMFKKMPSKNKRNPAFTGYIKSKPQRKIGKYPAIDQMMAWAVVFGELG
jgi:hypothetical protein